MSSTEPNAAPSKAVPPPQPDTSSDVASPQASSSTPLHSNNNNNNNAPTTPCCDAMCANMSVSSNNNTFVRTNTRNFNLGASKSDQEGHCLRMDVGVCSKQGARKTMEDQHVTAKSEKETPVHFFAVYDGHGGTKCAEFLRDNLHGIVLDHPKLVQDPELALRESVAAVEEQFTAFSRESKDCSGSTAAVALIVNDETLVTANVGDSEIVLCRDGAPLVLSTRHVPNNSSEEARVIAAGGRMYRHRVGHPKFNPEFVSLGVSRAIGDIGFKLDEFTDGKQSGVIADADTRCLPLHPTDAFLIMACDGLWDVMNYEDVVRMCAAMLKNGTSTQEITDALVAEALKRGSTDNVTCLFLQLTVPASPRGNLLSPDGSDGNVEGINRVHSDVGDDATTPKDGSRQQTQQHIDGHQHTLQQQQQSQDVDEDKNPISE
eukprot:PhM_4_TR3009/c1_g4_i1/m.37810